MNPQQIFNASSQPPGYVNSSLRIPANSSVQFPVYNNGNVQFPPVWSHIPQTNINWNTQVPDIVRFTGASNEIVPIYSQCTQYSGPIKRKSFPDDDDSSPNKILITEDKMAAKMREMRISSDNNISDNDQDADLEVADLDNNDVSMTNTKAPQLYVLEKLQPFRPPDAVPRHLLKFDTPSTALMVWRPPRIPLECYDDNNTRESTVTITEIDDSFDFDNYVVNEKSRRSPIPLPYIEGFSDTSDAMEM